MSPVFIPLDLKLDVDVDAITNYLSENTEPFTKWWSSAIIRRKVLAPDKFVTQLDSRIDFLKRYEEGVDWVWSEGFQVKFPELVSFMENLPFKKITHCHLLSQSVSVEPHRDIPNNRTMGVSDAEASKFNQISDNFDHEPILYKLMLGEIPKDSFYVCSNGKGDDKVYVDFPKDVRCFLVPENSYYHGADTIRGTGKIVCSMYGLVDYDKHEELVLRSIKKYPEQVLWAKTPEKPLSYHNDFCDESERRAPEPRDEYQPIPLYKQKK